VPLGDLTPRQRTRLFRAERFVGLFVLVAGALMTLGFVYYLYHTAERRGWFVPSCPYYTFVQSADGLTVGDPILLMGFSVGEITRIDAQPPNAYYNVYVAFDVRQPYYGYIWTDSKVRIASADLLGGRALEVIKGVAGQPTAYEEEGKVEYILADDQKVRLEDAPKGVFLMPQEDPTLSERAEALLAQLEVELPKIVEQVEQLLTSTNTMVDSANVTAEDAQPVLANLETITAQLTDPEGSFGRWLLSPELREELSATLTTLNSGLRELNDTLQDVSAMSGSLRGQVEANDYILDEISSLVTETDDLVKGLQQHWLLRSAFTPDGTLAPLPETIDDPLVAPPGEGAR
jgi:ABC-type transporter Mla subunit MlaD